MGLDTLALRKAGWACVSHGRMLSLEWFLVSYLPDLSNIVFSFPSFPCLLSCRWEPAQCEVPNGCSVVRVTLPLFLWSRTLISHTPPGHLTLQEPCKYHLCQSLQIARFCNPIRDPLRGGRQAVDMWQQQQEGAASTCARVSRNLTGFKLYKAHSHTAVKLTTNQ